LETPHIFAGDRLDRADRERRDPAWIAERLERAESRFLAFDRLEVLIERGPSPVIAWRGPEVLAHAAPGADPVLLGLEGDVAHFAVDVTGGGAARIAGAAPGAAFEEARGIAPLLPGEEPGLLAHARSMVDWHARHGFCANCGKPTSPRRGGKERVCEGCGAHHFPRTDPVAIMLVHHGDRCLLGRSRRRVTGNYSALAGFIDQGESIEEAVRREVAEEAGIVVGPVRYHSSQPWPFPSSLMIGCLAEAESTEIVMDEHELSEVGWFDRDVVRDALREPDQPRDGLRVPGPIAIAHHLIRHWALEL
jgi:NAD+ diphosphatase